MSTALLPHLLLADPKPETIAQRNQELARGDYLRIDPTLSARAGLGVCVDCTPAAHELLATLPLDRTLARLVHTIRANRTHLLGAWAPVLKLPGITQPLLVDIEPEHITLTTPSDQNRCSHCFAHIADPHDPSCPDA